MPWTRARSISRPTHERLWGLQERQPSAHVLAVFERACDLITPGGDVIALVTPEVGNGPFHIVVDGAAGLFSGVTVGAPVTLGREALWVDELQVDLRDAALWEPRPDWDVLRAACRPDRFSNGRKHPPCQVCGLPALDEASQLHSAIYEATQRTARVATEDLRAGWEGNRERLRAGAAALAGLGGGLTPAGDDFLSGAMLWAWLTHPTPATLCRVLADVAAPRTMALSAAFLRAASRGECTAAWHTLLAALSEGTEAQVMAAARGVIAHGATSGTDALAGFLFVCQPPTGQPQTLRVLKTLRVSGRDIHSKDCQNETNLS